MKLARPRLALAGQMAWVQDFSDPQIKGIGVLEVLAAIGLVVPPLVHIAVFLTPLAGVGLVLLMGGGHSPAPARAADGGGQRDLADSGRGGRSCPIRSLPLLDREKLRNCPQIFGDRRLELAAA